MTIQEASKRYNIPLDVLREYESWGLCGAVKKVMGAWQYDEEDIQRLSTIMTLHDIGFTNDEVERYMRLLLEEKDTGRERLRMLSNTGTARWTKSISNRSSSTGWTTSGIKSRRRPNHHRKNNGIKNE